MPHPAVLLQAESNGSPRPSFLLAFVYLSRRTALLIACEPKWPLTGIPNTNVEGQNGG